jgi:hypothetical protein
VVSVGKSPARLLVVVRDECGEHLPDEFAVSEQRRCEDAETEDTEQHGQSALRRIGWLGDQREQCEVETDRESELRVVVHVGAGGPTGEVSCGFRRVVGRSRTSVE